MDKLLKKIYKEVINHEKETIYTYRKVDDEINSLIKPYESRLNPEELEELKNMLYTIAVTAEQAGFEVGVQFITKLLCSMLFVK